MSESVYCLWRKRSTPHGVEYDLMKTGTHLEIFNAYNAINHYYEEDDWFVRAEGEPLEGWMYTSGHYEKGEGE
jgi:hypothetical protein